MPKITRVAAEGYILWAGYIAKVPVFVSGSGTVTIGAEARSVRPGGALLAAARARDEKSLFLGDADGHLIQIAADGSGAVIAEKGKKWIDQVAAGPNGTVAFAAGRTVWLKEPGGREHELSRPRAVGGLAFFPKGVRLAIAGYNGVGLWFPGTAAAPQELEWKGAHTAVTVEPNGNSVVTAMQEHALHGWRLKDGQHMRMSGYPTKVKAMSWSVKGRFLATAGAGAAICWPFHFKEGPMGKRPLELGSRRELVTMVAAHPFEEIVAIGYEDGMILLVRFLDGEAVLLRRPGEGAISALGWNAGGLELAFGSEAGEAGVVALAE